MVSLSLQWIASFALASTISSTVSAQNENDATVTGFDFEVLGNRLPKPLSDFTAVSDYSSGKVYLQGGCDSINGNRFNSVFKEFVCDSISNSTYVFDLETKTFTETMPMPMMRYRHAAVLVSNQIWLVGGRDFNDDIVTAVVVYDIADDTWTSYENITETYQLSDLAGFAGPDGLAYFCGGYNFTYAAQAHVFSIDPVATKNTGELMLKQLSPLPTARGDLSAVTAFDIRMNTSYALVTGGFTHENNFCDPLSASERYDFESNSWSKTFDLVVGRGDKALVVLNDRIFALAGERQLANICLVSPDDPPEPGEETVPIDDVEWFNAQTNNWTAIEDLPRFRFRFAAVGYEDKIYSFGGQLAYSDSCECFPTSDEVIVYEEANSPTSAALVVPSFGNFGSLILSGLAFSVLQTVIG